MTAIYGIFGWPVGHSRSPAMQGAAFAALGIDAVYVPFAVPPERLAQAVEALDALGVAGVNVTLPHKAAVLPLLGRVEPRARAIGAVNTIWREGKTLVGGNTDAEGLARALAEAGVGVRGARVVVLGAGGAARASVVGLAEAGAKSITVAARHADRAQVLVGAVASGCAGTTLAASGIDATLAEAFAESDLVVQATSATLGAGDGPERFAAALPLDALPRSSVVCDLVYEPLRTAVLTRAAERGLRTVDGLGMLLHQGAVAFERWTGRPAPLEAMRAALVAR